MKTKKEIRAIYRDQNSRNRIEDKLIQSAINEIGRMGARGYDVKLNENTIVDMAYNLQAGREAISAAASVMGKKGGSSRTPKKSASSAANLDGNRKGWPKGKSRSTELDNDIRDILMHPDVSRYMRNRRTNPALDNLLNIRKFRKNSKAGIRNMREDVSLTGHTDSNAKLPDAAWYAERLKQIDLSLVADDLGELIKNFIAKYTK